MDFCVVELVCSVLCLFVFKTETVLCTFIASFVSYGML